MFWIIVGIVFGVPLLWHVTKVLILRPLWKFQDALLATEPMICPFCGKPLSVTGQERLETLDHHVCCPNDDPPLQNTYGCTDKYCVAAALKLIWDRDGYFYHSKGVPELAYFDYKTLFGNRSTEALNSYACGSYIVCAEKKRRIGFKRLFLEVRPANASRFGKTREWDFQLIYLSKDRGMHWPLSGFPHAYHKLTQFVASLRQKALSDTIGVFLESDSILRAIQIIGMLLARPTRILPCIKVLRAAVKAPELEGHRIYKNGKKCRNIFLDTYSRSFQAWLATNFPAYL